MEPLFAEKFRSICMKNEKHDFSFLSKAMLFRFDRLTLLANIFSLQFTEISEYQPSSSYRASQSWFFLFTFTVNFAAFAPLPRWRPQPIDWARRDSLASVFFCSYTHIHFLQFQFNVRYFLILSRPRWNNDALPNRQKLLPLWSLQLTYTFPWFLKIVH